MTDTVNSNTIKSSVRNFVTERLVEYGITTSFTDDDSLIHSGLLDSLAIIFLVMFIEEKYQVDFSEFSFEADEFDNINAITHVVEKLI